MLAFMDALCSALLARNSIEIHRLLGLPQAKGLPREVREEAIAVARGGPASHVAPIRALHMYYKLTHLVNEAADPEIERRSEEDEAAPQIQFPFRARKVG